MHSEDIFQSCLVPLLRPYILELLVLLAVAMHFGSFLLSQQCIFGRHLHELLVLLLFATKFWVLLLLLPLPQGQRILEFFFKSCLVPLLRPCISGAAAIATDFRGFLFWGVVAAMTLHFFLLLVAILLLTTIIWHFQR